MYIIGWLVFEIFLQFSPALYGFLAAQIILSEMRASEGMCGLNI